MKKFSIILIVLNLIGLLLYYNFSIKQKEDIIQDGQLVLLHLAPVDPRSLMQGDYMRLNYEIGMDMNLDNIPKRGYFVVKLDSNQVGRSVRVQADNTDLQTGEYFIEYNRSHWNLQIGAESYFFEEGTGSRFENAVYGGLKIDQAGHSVLVGLYDKNWKRID